MQTKKRKLQDEVEDKLERARNVVDLSQFEYVDDEEFCKVTAFCQNPKTAIKILGKIMQTMPDIKGPRND